MKKNALALAVAGVMAGVASVPSVSMAGVGPTLYGQGNVSLDVVDNGDTKDLNASSNSSRIGVKGSYTWATVWPPSISSSGRST